jgi:hypothetical protein
MRRRAWQPGRASVPRSASSRPAHGRRRPEPEVRIGRLDELHLAERPSFDHVKDNLGADRFDEVERHRLTPPGVVVDDTEPESGRHRREKLLYRMAFLVNQRSAPALGHGKRKKGGPGTGQRPCRRDSAHPFRLAHPARVLPVCWLGIEPGTARLGCTLATRRSRSRSTENCCLEAWQRHIRRSLMDQPAVRRLVSSGTIGCRSAHSQCSQRGRVAPPQALRCGIPNLRGSPTFRQPTVDTADIRRRCNRPANRTDSPVQRSPA